MTKFVQVNKNTFVSVDKIINIQKKVGTSDGKGTFQYDFLCSDGEYRTRGGYTSEYHWLIFTSNDIWEGTFRITDSEFFEGIEDLLKATCSNVVL